MSDQPLKVFLELYAERGIAVLPAVYGEKRPSVEWKIFQENGPSKAQVKEWFKEGVYNIAVLCGTPSGNLVVLDFDDVSVYTKFFDKEKIEKETLVVETGSGKIHVYMRSDKPVESFRIPQLKLEVRSTGNIVIAPPSKHPSGGFYKFVNPEVKSLITVTDLADAVWRKAEKLGVKTPIDVFSETAEECGEAPYEGPDPPCIAKLLHGVEEGYRNEATMRIATYWLKFKRNLDKGKTLERLKHWNRHNKPPLPERELESVVESALKLGRSYGCRHNQAWCSLDACVLMRNRLLRAEAEEEAEKIISSSNVLEALKPHLDNILAGEDENKQLAFLLMLSGKIDDASLKQMVLLKGESGAGKSKLMTVADAFRVKDVGRFSAHALDYTDLENFDVLRPKELGAMDQEFQGVSTVKFLSSDDRGYTVEVAERDVESGRFTTHQYRIPPITLVTSTIRVSLDPQFERRAWILNPDESKEQTERIRIWKANLERDKAAKQLGLLKETSYEHSLRVLKAVVRKLEPHAIILPFPDSLTQILNSTRLRVRGDYDKIIALVKLHAFLHQRVLPKAQGANGHKVVFVSPQYALDALKVALKPFVTMTTELEDRSRRLIAILRENNVKEAGDSVESELRGKIAVQMGRSDKTVYRYLQNLCDAGYMTKEKVSAKGNPASFKLLVDLDVIEEKAAVTLDISNASKTISLEAVKEAENWLNSILDKITFTDGWSTYKLRETMNISIAHEVGSQKTPSVNHVLSEMPSEPKSSSSQPTEPSTLLALKMSQMAIPVSQTDIQHDKVEKRASGDVVQLLCEQWPKDGLQKEESLQLIMCLGNYAKHDAEQLFERLVEEGRLAWIDRGGVTVWLWV